MTVVRANKGRLVKTGNSTTDQVAELMSQGLEAEAIAARMGISKKAVSARQSDIRKQLEPQAT